MKAEGCPLRQKFAASRRELSAALIERDDEIDLALTALACQEHVLLVGPPGTAKSLLLDSLMRWTSGKRFTALLTKFSVPEELFGPVSLKALKEDRYVRVTAGRLPEAHFAFLDEVFKASSAILNTLLRILNERAFENGDGALMRVPLLLCVGASNEWPNPEDGGKELQAAFDRFLFRKTVRPVLTQSGRQRLLWDRDHTPVLSTTVSPEEVSRARDEATALPWSAEGKEALGEVLRELTKEGVRPGDRRQFKAVSAAQAFAWLSGADEVQPEHLEVLAHVLWDDPTEQPEVCARVIARVANPVGMRVNGLLLECEQVLSSADPRNLSQAATATAKLAEIDKALASLKGDARAERARAYVKDQARRLRLASIDAI